MQIRKIIIKPLSLFSILFIGALAEANDYVIGKGYLIPPGVVYCDANAIENQVEFLPGTFCISLKKLFLPSSFLYLLRFVVWILHIGYDSSCF